MSRFYKANKKYTSLKIWLNSVSVHNVLNDHKRRSLYKLDNNNVFY